MQSICIHCLPLNLPLNFPPYFVLYSPPTECSLALGTLFRLCHSLEMKCITENSPPNHFYVSDSALVVGFEQTAYTVDEVDGYQLVCIVVLSGDVDGREIVLDYKTSSGTASRL